MRLWFAVRENLFIHSILVLVLLIPKVSILLFCQHSPLFYIMTGSALQSCNVWAWRKQALQTSLRRVCVGAAKIRTHSSTHTEIQSHTQRQARTYTRSDIDWEFVWYRPMSLHSQFTVYSRPSTWSVAWHHSIIQVRVYPIMPRVEGGSGVAWVCSGWQSPDLSCAEPGIPAVQLINNMLQSAPCTVRRYLATLQR